MIIGQEENKTILRRAIVDNIPCLLMGETGTGKTSIIRELAQESGQELIRINLTGQTSTDEFLGKWLIRENATYWQDGALIQAMKKGTWLVIDEINAALPEILFALHSLLDDERAVLLSEKDGEIVKPNNNFRLFATMNPETEYAGTKELNKAFLSRFAIVLWFDYPNPKDEQKILSQFTDKDTAGLMVEVGNKIREYKKSESIFYTCSTRDLIQWAVLSEPLGIDKAFKSTILNKALQDSGLITCAYNEVFKPLEEKLEAHKVNTLAELLNKIDKEEKALEEKRVETQNILNKLEEEKKNIVAELVQFKAVEKAQKIRKGAKNGKPKL